MIVNVYGKLKPLTRAEIESLRKLYGMTHVLAYPQPLDSLRTKGALDYLRKNPIDDNTLVLTSRIRKSAIAATTKFPVQTAPLTTALVGAQKMALNTAPEAPFGVSNAAADLSGHGANIEFERRIDELQGKPQSPSLSEQAAVYQAGAEAFESRYEERQQAHLETLIAEPERDNFETESPLRCFTDFNEGERYAIGKGFRPSVQHLVRYLDAIAKRTPWRLLQVLNPSGPITVMFEREVKLEADAPAPVYAEVRFKAPPHHWPLDCVSFDGTATFVKDLYTDFAKAALADLPEAPADDPVNPKHYGGDACAILGEQMTANCYQVFKCCWREGKKGGDAGRYIDLNKALWYLDREIAIYGAGDESARKAFNTRVWPSALPLSRGNSIGEQLIRLIKDEGAVPTPLAFEIADLLAPKEARSAYVSGLNMARSLIAQAIKGPEVTNHGL